MAAPELTDEQFFGGQGYAYGPGAPESGQAPTPEQQTYARAMAQHLDRGAPLGTPQNPSYDTPTVKADGSIYHVGPDGKLYDPVATAQAETKPALLSDEAFFGSKSGDFTPGQQFDTRQTSQGLGAAEGAFTVGKNVTSALTGDIPTAPPSIDKLNLMMHPLALAGRLGLGMLRGQLDKAETTQRPGQVGKIGTEIALTLPLAAMGEGTPALVGALQGGLTSEAPTPVGRLADIGLGALGGKVGDALTQGGAGVIKPTLRPEAQWALDNGIRLTPGGIAGSAKKGSSWGILKNVETAAANGTLVGPMVGGAQRQGIEDFNLATARHVLDGTGVELPEGLAPGHEVVDATRSGLNGAFNSLTPKLSLAQDPLLEAARSEAVNAGTLMEPAFRNRMDAIIGQLPVNGGPIEGNTVQRLTSQLRREAATAASSPDFFTKDYGDAIRGLSTAVDDALERSNPAHAEQLQALRTAWAKQLRVEKAAVGAVQDGGVFTPKSLLAATKTMDQSAGDNATASGKALLQDWANSGKAVLPNTLPGSQGNSLVDLLKTGVMHAPELSVGLGVEHESGVKGLAAMLAAEGGLGLLYTKPVQNALRAAMTSRPAAAQPISDVVRRLAPYSGLTTAFAANKGLLPWAEPSLAETIAPLLNYRSAAPQAQAGQSR